jgi:hypothetical protein
MVEAEPRRRRGQPAGAGHGEEGAQVVPVEGGHGPSIGVCGFTHNGSGIFPMVAGAQT